MNNADIGTSSTLIALNKWIQQTGISATTAWRWRKKGWLEPINICGRLYLTSENLDRLIQRGRRGELAQPPQGVCAVGNTEHP